MGSVDANRRLDNKLKRLLKEAAYYKEEVKENEEKLERMKIDEKDPYDIKKFEEVLGESQMMIPDSERRLKETLDDLSLLLDTTELKESESLALARELLKKSPDEQPLQETQVEDDADAF